MRITAVEGPGARGAIVPLQGRRALRIASGIAGFALLTWVGARIAVPLPFTPVPGTLQTLAVLLAGLFLGARAGAASQAAYLALGIAGLPVFALPGGGPGYLFGPTGGYLAGFVAGAWVTGRVYRAAGGAGGMARLAALMAGTAAIHIPGLAWLALHPGGDLRWALASGVMPFLLFDAAKIAVAAGIHSGALSLAGGGRGRWKRAIGRYGGF